MSFFYYMRLWRDAVKSCGFSDFCKTCGKCGRNSPGKMLSKAIYRPVDETFKDIWCIPTQSPERPLKRL